MENLSPREINRRNSILRNLFSHLEQRMQYDVTESEEGLKLKIYALSGGRFPDVVMEENLSYVDYQGNFYRFPTGQKGRVFAECDGKSRRPIIENPNTQDSYISVPAEQFGRTAEVRIGWFE